METLFIQMPELDCESWLSLNGLFYADCSSSDAESAMNRFIANNAMIGRHSYKTVYAKGHYGDENHLWEMTRCELYYPTNPSQNPVVLVYYRPTVVQCNKNSSEQHQDLTFRLPS